MTGCLKEFEDLAADVGHQLRVMKLKLATAESCTGGWIAQTVTSITGSSGWFDRGFVTYSNTAKQEMLNVSERSLTECGAVSKEVVMAMAEGALINSQADVSVAVTGIAGPDGGTELKPVGTVWIAWARTGQITQARQYLFDGDRQAVRSQTVKHALSHLLDILK